MLRAEDQRRGHILGESVTDSPSPIGVTQAQYIDCFQKIKYSFNLLVCGSPQVPMPSPRPSHPLLSGPLDTVGPGVLVKVVGWDEGW